MQDTRYKEKIAEILIEIESVKFSFEKPFILTSGLKSPVYVDCRKIIGFVKQRTEILKLAREYFLINNIEFDIIAGGETAGIPYAAFLSEQLEKQMIYVRKKPKNFGKNQQIEGSFKSGQKALLVEDLATDGGSKILFVKAMRDAGLKVNDVFVIFYYDIFDYQNSPLFDLNVKIHSLCTWKNILDVISNKKIFSNVEVENIKKFLFDPDDWRKKYG